jgi:LuxR family transcriptional regulator, quorum-sensing system regulator BjaR1
MREHQRFDRIAFDFVERIDSFGTADEVLAELKNVVERLGFASFIVTGLPLPHRPLEPLVMLSAWPPEWFERYMKRDYFRKDPVSQQALVTSSPFIWRDVPPVFSAAREAVELMGEAREFGLVDGFCVPLYGITGWQAGLSFGTDRAVDLGRRQLAALHLIAISAHGRMRALHGEPDLPAPRLTPREREVLAWVAAGKTAWETSCILHVAEKTVRAHLESIRQKLNVASITQAVASALRSGELQPY